jgi:RNA polymerase sigma-70 factor (ECF subfamily)
VGFSDAHLITRVLRAGDPNAFGELVRRYQSPVRSFLRRLTRGDEALADDLAQETFLRAWRKLETFRAEARFSSWLEI